MYYIGHVLKYPKYLLGVGLTVPLAILINAYLPALILADVLSKLSQHTFQPTNLWGSFGPELIAYACLLIGGIFVWRLVDRFGWRLETRIQQDMSEEIFRHLLSRSADFHANNFSGSLVSQTNKLVSGYVRVADTTYYQVYPMFAGIIIATIILTPRAPLFALALLVFALLFVIVALRAARPVQEQSARFSKIESKQTGFLADAMSNALTIKSFARDDYEAERFHKATEETKHHLRSFARLHAALMNKLGFMSRLISAISLFIAVIAVLNFNANIATVFLIFSYTSTIVEQLFQFGNASLRNYNRAFGDASDMATKLAEEPEVKDPTEPQVSRMGKGAIHFAQVTFTHAGADDAVFANLELTIQPGEKIGLVGYSGSGKSTFVRLLLRFSDIQSGQILIDDQDIAQVTQADLHRQIAYVPQEPLLFHRTIKENIAYGQLDASDAMIEETAKMASAHDFILELPNGYNTLVGERGVKLSGGQRQRVAIARAILKNAPILVLDEATSALDSESEQLIQAALGKLMKGRTSIVIAHRLSTIAKLDRIIVLDNGKIVEQGSHNELLGQKGTYAKLWSHQSGGFIEE